MKGIDNKRKVIIFTVLLMTAFMISSYGKSCAKYYKIENDSITYNLGFDALTKDGIGKFSIVYNNSTHFNAYFRYTVPRNTIMTSSDTNDNYRILVNSGCEIKKVNGTSINGATNIASFNYSNNTSSDITIEYSCPVDELLITNSTNFFDTDIVIYEQMTTDYKEFIYLKQESEVYDINKNLPAEIVGDYHILTILESDDETTIDSKINTWLSSNISNYDGSGYGSIKSALQVKVLLDYFKKGYNNDIKNYDDSLVRGVKANHIDNTYTFEINNDFLAYAVTDNKIQSPPPIFKPLYFADITKTDDELQEIFEYYVDKYIYSNTTDDYVKLINYVNTNGGVSKVLRGTGTITGLNYADGLMIVYNNILTNATQISSVNNSINKVPNDMETVKPTAPAESDKTDETTFEENIIVNKILSEYKELLSDNARKFIEVDKDFSITSEEDVKLNDYIIYNIDEVSLLINIYTDEEGIVNATVIPFDETLDLDLNTATKISIAIEYVEDYNLVIDKYNNIVSIIDSKYETKYANAITIEELSNHEQGKGLYIYSENNIIKIYLKNDNDEYNLGTLEISINENEPIEGEEVEVPVDPDKVVSGDTPNDDIPIFDDLVTNEPGIEVSDTVTGDNETVDENPENQEEEETEETEEIDDNSKKADTDIEKEFVDDIENLEKLIEDMKEYVGDAEEINEEEEAIQEVSDLIETVKDYINEV